MGRTVQVAADREGGEANVIPAELARGIYIENAPSAQALKVMHMMIATAGGAIAEDRHHEFQLSSLRNIEGVKHHDRESLTALFRELRAATFSFDDEDAQEVLIGGFLDTARISYRHADRGEMTVRFWFGRAFREMADRSSQWTIIDRQTVYAMRSRYSILLFQHLASLVNLRHKFSETFTLEHLRAIMAVPSGKMDRWNDFNRFVLRPALEEITQLARFTVSSETIKDGRNIAKVKISWSVKANLAATKKELGAHSVGRKARRAGTAELIAPTFPASDGVSFTKPFAQIAEAAGITTAQASRDVAEAFRRSLRHKDVPLDAPDVAKLFEDFCRVWAGA